MNFDRGVLTICAYGADGIPNLSRPKVCECGAFFRTPKRRRNHYFAFHINLYIFPRATFHPYVPERPTERDVPQVIGGVPPMPPPPRRHGVTTRISRYALTFLLQFNLSDAVMGRILSSSPLTIASIRRNDLGVLIAGPQNPATHPCEVCGEKAQIGPDYRGRRHGWICQACRIATEYCNTMHRWLLDHKDVLEKLREANAALQQTRDRKATLVDGHHRAMAWLNSHRIPAGESTPEHAIQRAELKRLIDELHYANEAIEARKFFLLSQGGILQMYMEAQFGGSLIEDKEFVDFLLETMERAEVLK